MSKFEKLYKQICYTRTLRGLNNLLLRNWKFTTMNAPILRHALRSDFTCVTGISASGKYFRKQVLLAKHFPWTSVYPKSAIPSLSAQRLRIWRWRLPHRALAVCGSAIPFLPRKNWATGRAVSCTQFLPSAMRMKHPRPDCGREQKMWLSGECEILYKKLCQKGVVP